MGSAALGRGCEAEAHMEQNVLCPLGGHLRCPCPASPGAPAAEPTGGAIFKSPKSPKSPYLLEIDHASEMQYSTDFSVSGLVRICILALV